MLNSFDTVPARDRVIVALDCKKDEALFLADTLRGKATWVKVGMTLFCECGPDIVRMLKQRGFKVFLDLKFHDIPHQIENAAYEAARSGADMLTMHTLGGTDMMEAAQRGVKRAATERKCAVPVTLGITVLTSLDEAALAESGITRALFDEVIALAEQACRAGLSGVVASPREASRLREVLGPHAYIVTPGVRNDGAGKDDQSRTATPAQAFKCGASHIVVGRPITQAPDPQAAFEALVAGL